MKLIGNSVGVIIGNEEKIMEEEYKKTLFFIGNKIMEGESWKPLNAHFANQIAEVAYKVAEGSTLENAIKEITTLVEGSSNEDK